MKINKSHIKPVAALFVICALVAALMAAVNIFTEPVISEADRLAVKESLSIVMPEGEFDAMPGELPADAPESVRAIYKDKNGKGHVVTLVTTKGYTGNEIGITVAIGADEKLIKAVITKNDESIVPSDMKPFGSYGDAYSGVGAYGVFDVVTGATVQYSEAAIKDAIYDAFVALGYAEPRVDDAEDEDGSLPTNLTAATGRDEKWAFDKAQALKPGCTLESKNVENSPKTLMRVYKSSDGGFVFYVAKRHDYVPTMNELEVFFATDRGGKITKFDLVSWNVGHGVNYDGEFTESFVGKTLYDLEHHVDLVSGATSTSVNIRDAVVGAMKTQYSGASPYTVIAIVALCLALLGFVGVLICFKRRKINGKAK